MGMPASLSDQARAFLSAKAAADQTYLGRNIRDAQNYLKADFYQSCQDNNGWNQSLAKLAMSGMALQKITEWAHRWKAPNDRLMLPYTAPLVSTAVQYNNICSKEGKWSKSDLALVAAAERTRAVYKAAVLAAFNKIGADGVKKVLADEIALYPKLERVIDDWHARYEQ